MCPLQLYEFHPTSYNIKTVQRCKSFDFLYCNWSTSLILSMSKALILFILQIKSHKDLVHFETAYVVKLHRVARLAPSQPVSFSFGGHHCKFLRCFWFVALWYQFLQTFCLALIQVFTFTHPEYSTTKDNQRYKKLQFEIPHDSGSVMVHGMQA